MKQINVKQAEKWLDKLKNEDTQAYKDITKFLRKYQKTEDEYDCFTKINTTLLNHTNLTIELNAFMEEGNKMVVCKPEEEKIKDLMNYIKKTRPEVFTNIIKVIQQMSSNMIPHIDDMNNHVKTHIKEIIKHDSELNKITEEALDMKGQQLIARLDLEHLKSSRLNPMLDEFQEEASKQKTQRVVNKKQNAKINQKEIIQEPKVQRAIPFLSITSIDDEKFIFKHLEKILDSKTYQNLIKIIKIYYANIISKNQAVELVNALDCEEQLEFLRDIIDTREADRRRLSVFKPLNDLDFSNCQRASPSYVIMPISYPNICKGKTEFFKQFLNDTWVSVPHGSEQNFNVRFKNSNQLNLLKSQDQRYQFDLYMMRLHKSQQMLKKILNSQETMNDQKASSLIDKIISMGIIQLIYKNCTKQQKQELEWHLKTNQQQTLKILRDRISFQIKEMEQIKSIHAIRAWLEVAQKNFSKALDLKGFQFKKNQKDKIKSASFVSELHQRTNNLNNGGEAKLNLLIPFQDRRQFFEILNSFEASSRTQKCLKRKLPQIETYDLHDQSKRKFYPVMIMAFENKAICQKVYGILLFYIDSYTMGDNQKLRCKLFLQNLLINYLGWQQPTKRYLNQQFDEEKLYAKINNPTEQNVNLSSWINQTLDEKIGTVEPEQSIPTLLTQNQNSSTYGYLPKKSEKKKVLYGSEHVYALIRFIYTLYERLIKVQEVAESQQKVLMFQILFYACIKAKEGVKFEQNLNTIFGKHAYLFSTIYKLCDNLIRSLSAVSSCLVSIESLRLSKLQSEDIYLLLLNKFCLANQLSNNKLIRLTYQTTTTVLYVNLLQSFYKIDDNPKDLTKKRTQLSRGIDIYTLDSWYYNTDKKKRKLNEIAEKNNQEYIFEGSTLKMLNHRQNEDILSFLGKSNLFTKNMKKQVKRVSVINQMLN